VNAVDCTHIGDTKVLVNARVTVAGILSALPQELHLPEASPTAPAPNGGSI
jgi:hypothetical protein